DQGLDEQDQEVEVEQGFDSAFVLEEHWGDLEDGLALGEALLDGGLALVGLEDLGIGEGAIVAQERIHAVGFAVVGDGGLIDREAYLPVLLALALVVGVRSRAAAAGLAELVSEFVDQFDPQVAPHPIAAQHALEVLEDLLAGTAPGPRPREAGVEGLKRLGGRQQALAPALPPAQLPRRALAPTHGPPFMRGQERALYPPAIARGALTTTIGPIPEQLPGRLVRLQPLTELTVLPARARKHAHAAPAAPIDMIHGRFRAKFTVRDI